MMRKLKTEELIGVRSGALVIIGIADRSPGTWVVVKCDCGIERVFRPYKVTLKQTRSCGCLKGEFISKAKTKHGGPKNHKRAYRAWSSMRSRCLNKDNREFKYYGGRGISVCDRWMRFENFLEDMGDPPPDHSIGRINNDGPYSPSNCRWETRVQQNNNTRKNKFLTFLGETLSYSQWERRLGFKSGTLHQRIKIYGWNPHRAITTPTQPGD